MRTLAVWLSLSLLVVSGCDFFKRMRNETPPDPGITVNGPRPEVVNLVAYMNDNAKRIQAVQATDIQIDCRQDHQSVGVSAMMVCQKPHNFRLKGKVAGNPVVDLGSNDKEFWFWTSQEKPAYVRHCDFADLRTGEVPLPFPFQPDMIVCALGIAEYDPSKTYKLDVKQHGNLKTYELSEPILSVQGKPMTKVTVFNGVQRQAPNPQVLAYILRDENGKETCRATITSVTVDKRTSAVLPHILKIDWPAEKIEMTMKLYDVQSVADLPPQRAARLFGREDLSSYPDINLARMRRDRPDGFTQGTSLQRVRGQMPPR